MSVMTPAMKSAVATLTRDEARILAHYAAGESIDTIAAETRQSRGDVAMTIEGYTNRDRSQAQALAVAWQQANPAAGRAPAPAKPADGEPGTVTALIDAARRTGAPRLLRLAEKTQALVDDLTTQLADHEREQALRAEADRLEARLAQIRTQLGGGKKAVDTKAVRAWALASGITCPTYGRIPASVIAAYEQRGDQ